VAWEDEFSGPPPVHVTREAAHPWGQPHITFYFLLFMSGVTEYQSQHQRQRYIHPNRCVAPNCMVTCPLWEMNVNVQFAHTFEFSHVLFSSQTLRSTLDQHYDDVKTCFAYHFALGPIVAQEELQVCQMKCSTVLGDTATPVVIKPVQVQRSNYQLDLLLASQFLRISSGFGNFSSRMITTVSLEAPAWPDRRSSCSVEHQD
jgi:hypothetical protein